MTDSMKFGPEWLRNLSSDGSTAGSTTNNLRYQLADYRYGREEMLALFEKSTKPPHSLSSFPPLYSEPVLPPLALLPQGEEERGWQTRSIPQSGSVARGRGGSLERGGRVNRGRPSYQSYGRGYETGGTNWGAGTEPNEWSPRKVDYTSRASSVDNWRRNRMSGSGVGDDDEGWRSGNNHHSATVRNPMDKWSRSTSWRDGSDGGEERVVDRSGGSRVNWQDNTRPTGIHRRAWEGGEDHLPEWAMENPSESGGTFDSSGAFHGSDDEQRARKREIPLQKSVSQQSISVKNHPSTLPTSQSALSLSKPPDDDTKLTSKLLKEPSNSIDEEKPPETLIKTAEIVKLQETRTENIKLTKNIDVGVEPKSASNVTVNIGSSGQQNDKNKIVNSGVPQDITTVDLNNKVEEEFDRMQEDIVKKLVVDEDTPRKPNMVDAFGITPNSAPTMPPPNLTSVAQDKWYYQDPQGDLQGPFLPSEMAEWFRAGYFTSTLLVKRLCDETFYRLGDLVTLYGGNPFQSSIRIPPLKPDIPNTSDADLLQYQMFQRQMVMNRQPNAPMRVMNHPDPWASLCNPPQRDLLTQQVLQHPQITPDLQFMQQSAPPPTSTNPLMQMINQMQQANKLPTSTLSEKPPTLQPQLDPIQVLVQQMGGLSSIQNPSNIPGLPTSVPNSVPLSVTGLGNAGLLSNFQGLSSAGLTGTIASNPNVPLSLSSVGGQLQNNPTSLLVNSGLSSGSLPNVGSGISSVLPSAAETTSMSSSGGLPPTSGLPSSLSTLPPRPNPLGAVDPLAAPENEAFKNLLRQLASKQQNSQLDSLWQQNQFNNTIGAGGVVPTPAPAIPKITQWQPNSISEAATISMWDYQSATSQPAPVSTIASSEQHQKQPQQQPQQPQHQQQLPAKPVNNVVDLTNKAQEKERQKQLKEMKDAQEKELKKKKELEEKQVKKEAEERRKEEQRKLEAEKKLVEDKKKKEEERIRKELERAKKEAEEKRQKELEEKRRLKEQRKAEEETRKKMEEQRKFDELERAKREVKEREEKQKALEVERQETNVAKIAKVAPWCQSSTSTGISLAEIQKAEREKRAEQTALLQQQRSQQVLQEQQAVIEKQTLPFNWAKRPPEPRKVKSLAEIQQEEQERLAKQAAEQRIAQNKEREAAGNNPIPTTPWSGQNLSWANTAAQWNNPSSAGFWDETSIQHKSPAKSVPVSKSSSTSAMNVNKQQQPLKTNKNKTKKEEQQVMKLFSNGPATDEFTAWCTIALGKLTNTIDIPTFISFLRDIESALDIREYCKEYLGDSPSTQQFATQFLEKRRLIKPKNVSQKDDMNAPAPAINPSSQLHPDFQEGKGKKIKKSKMTKVDNRILGFSVTSAPDRINVGARDYVEN